ncbi:MAG: thiamine pyrophosphate-dependent dehydrogenase E1 component subunit alpha [Christensenellaceae bacterium]|jgi:pyruvate dehydrogenase E1 component alpha subunit|nr:thiamine pyrophosphate-dependent dehydrogenase E1 component subunit alpha [Christensenellaceae bacterium]
MQTEHHLPARAAAPYDKAFLQRVMERMLLVRKFEDRVSLLFEQGHMHGTTHLCAGEEGTAVGTGMALGQKDYMLSTHRSHGQTLGKGVSANAAMAEMFGKATGTNGGYGGSMHIADIECGALGSNGIVAANAPIACGAALALKLRGETDRVVAVYFGDGASNAGAMHESMNLASAWALPVLFVLENNTYGMSTPLYKTAADTDLTKRALPYAIKSFEVDGNDVLAVYETVRAARAYALEHSAPALIVEHTYRTSGHSKSDDNQYRTLAEIAAWEAKSPIARFGEVLLANGFSPKELQALETAAERAVDAAEAYARKSPSPRPEGLERAVFAD